MPTRRYYSNFPPQQTLAAQITSAATSLQVQGSFTGWPTQVPFYAVLEYGTTSAEIVLVTAITGTTATITRGQDGTIAIGHLAGATLDQSVIRQDIDEANAHTTASTGVHGIAGSVVGTSDTQTLTGKTLTSPVINTPSISGGTYSGGTFTTASLTAPTVTGGLSTDTLTVSGAITAASLGASTAYTPTWTGVTLGNGTVSGTYVKIGKLLIIETTLTFGTTTSVTGAISVSFPTGNTAVGNCDLNCHVNSNSGLFDALAAVSSGAGTALIYAPNSSSSSSLVAVGTSALVFASGNSIVVSGALIVN